MRSSEPAVGPNAPAMGEDTLVSFLEDMDKQTKKKPRGVSTNDHDFRQRMADRISRDHFNEHVKESMPDIKDFTIESGLGTGGFAAVAMVTHKSGTVRCCGACTSRCWMSGTS